MSEPEYTPKAMVGPIRGSELYVSWNVAKALKMLAKATGTPADAIGNQVLDAWLLEKHPEVVRHIEMQQIASDEFQKGLKEKLKPKLDE